MVLTGFYQPVKTGLVFTTSTLPRDDAQETNQELDKSSVVAGLPWLKPDWF